MSETFGSNIYYKILALLEDMEPNGDPLSQVEDFSESNDNAHGHLYVQDNFNLNLDDAIQDDSLDQDTPLPPAPPNTPRF